jgi:hypothetical protein
MLGFDLYTLVYPFSQNLLWRIASVVAKNNISAPVMCKGNNQIKGSLSF